MKISSVSRNEWKKSPLLKEFFFNGSYEFMGLTEPNLLLLHDDEELFSIVSFSFVGNNSAIKITAIKSYTERKGYATRLVETIFDKAKQKKLDIETFCLEDNQKGQAFFRKMKFKKIANDRLKIEYSDLL